ncbi:hypothetical protein [Capnocytophaga granulosa]|uniref:hypothetical protein n=1 Tax=Capnocytophaga granulosa TaxID=45242 RepID=UPI0028D29F99|nr:hypothetical protein [Capnocytophaga granulosa]
MKITSKNLLKNMYDTTSKSKESFIRHDKQEKGRTYWRKFEKVVDIKGNMNNTNYNSLNDFDFDTNTRLKGDFENMKNLSQELVERIKEELGVDILYFSDFIKYLIDRKGKKITDDIFPGITKIWELAGGDMSSVDNVYNKFFNPVEEVVALALELMQEGKLVDPFNDNTQTEIAKKATEEEREQVITEDFFEDFFFVKTLEESGNILSDFEVEHKLDASVFGGIEEAKDTTSSEIEEEKEELISKELFLYEEPVAVAPIEQEEPVKEPTEVTKDATEEVIELKKLIEEGQIKLGVPMPADVSPFDDSDSSDIDLSDDGFSYIPIQDSDEIINTEPFEIIDFDANASLEGDFENKRERAKEILARILEELGLEKPTFEDYIKYFIDRSGKKFVDENFPGYVKLWELAGYSLDDVNSVYDKFFNTASVATDLAFELMSNGTLVNKFNQGSEASAISSQAPVVATKGNKIIRDNRGAVEELIEDTSTENPTPKAAHLGIKYETVTLPDGTKAKRYSEVELNEDPFIDNHFVLDKDFLSIGRELEVRVAEDALVTVWDKDSNGNKVKKTVKFKDLGLQPGTPEYNAKVPIVAYYGDKPIFFLHDYEWYNRTNISNRNAMQDKVIKEGSRMINEVRRQILVDGKTKIRITNNVFGNMLNLSSAVKREDQEPITLNQASKGSVIVIAETTKTIKTGAHNISTADLVNNFEKKPLIPGAAYEIREIGNGKKILLSIASNRTGEAGSMPDIGYNTVKFGLLAAFYLLNKNDSRFDGTISGITKEGYVVNPTIVLSRDEKGKPKETKVVTVREKLESMGMTEDKALKIAEAIQASYGIDITKDTHLLFELFTTTATGKTSKQ